MNDYHKYIKYKKKYFKLRKQLGGRKKVLTKITHPIDGPKEVTIVLKPLLLYEGNVLADTYLTGIEKVDKIIKKRIANDHTRIKRILPFYYQSAYYFFGGGLDEKDLLEKDVDIIITNYQFRDGLIYLRAKKSNNNGFNKSDYQAIRIVFDPHDFGPDGYMVGENDIYQGPEIIGLVKKYEKIDSDQLEVVEILKTKTGYEPSDTVELVVEVDDILPHLDS